MNRPLIEPDPTKRQPYRSLDYEGKVRELVDAEGYPVFFGLILHTEPGGTEYVLHGGRAPQHRGDPGMVYAAVRGEEHAEQFPAQNFNLRWIL